MEELTKREAQALAVIASRLDRKRISRRITPDDLLDLIVHLGMEQLDTISVVSRSHETVLWSRLGGYDLGYLTTLFTDRRALTEYLVHAAAIMPVSYLPLVRDMMHRIRTSDEAWLDQPENQRLTVTILDRVKAEGAVNSRHFEAPPDAQPQGQWESWYGSKPEREALFALWASGELLVSLRDRSFSRWYDLPERVAPQHWHEPGLAGDQLHHTLLLHAIRAMGVGTVPWLTDYWRTGGRAYVPNAQVRTHMSTLAEAGTVLPVKIAGVKDAAWIDANLLPVLDQLRAGTGWPTRTTFLSPFDNLIWNRDRMWQLWDMHYRLEIYTPAAKRRYGYYTMPILHRGQLVGQIDPSMNRKEGVLTIRALHLQPGVKATPALARAIARSLDEFTAFLGGSDWFIVRSDPAGFDALVMQPVR